MSIITKEIKILLLVLVNAVFIYWLCFGTEALRYLGGHRLFPR